MAAATPARAPSTGAVVRAWTAALNSGNDAAAGRLFNPHASWIQGGYKFRLTNQFEAAVLTHNLPCSGRIAAMSVKGERATATFLLGNRPGRPRCATPGAKAATLFTVRHGKIVLWAQVPVPPRH
jgi:hypothetical protein